MPGLEIVLRFYNGDVHIERLAVTTPPGRLEWRDPDGRERAFWLDTMKWAQTGRAVYREVPTGDD